MKIKKGILTALLCTALACTLFGLAACGEKETPPPKNEYTLSFETFGGTEIDPVKVTEGETASPPQDPERYGYTFDGWFADNDLQTAFDFTKPVTEDTTAYAAWTDVTYLYLYYGEYGTDFKRFTYHAGDTITLADIAALFTPEPLMLEGVSCPFLHWRYEEYYDASKAEVTGDITVENRHILLVAVYDTSNVPPKKYLEEKNGGYVATGNVVWPFETSDSSPTAFSVNVTVTKGGSGGAGVAFRITHGGTDYAYEGNGTQYLAAIVSPSNGALQMSWIAPSAVSVGSAAPATWHAITTVAHSSLPDGFRSKWASAITRVSVEMGVVYETTGFRIYLDGALAYTFTDTPSDNIPYENYTGTGYGIRSSHAGALFKDPTLHTRKTVTFDTQGGNPQSGITHLYGALALPTPTTTDDGVVFGGWYYDAACEHPVDLTKPYLETEEDEVTLYANWTEDYITVSFDTNGGEPCGDVKYTGGALTLPTPKYTNRILEGWYYDEELERRVDPAHPEITQNTTLHAAWRYPLASVTQQSGVYSNTAGVSAFLMGETESRTVTYTVQMTVIKNGAGGGGIFFRGNVDADYAGEKTARYIAATVTLTGALQPCHINYSFAHAQNLEVNDKDHTVRNGPIPLDLLPAAWQQKWNAATDKTAVSLTLTVKDFADRYEIYIDGDLACTYKYTQSDLATYTAYGYGFRATQVGYTWHDIETTQTYSVTYSYEGGTKTEQISETATLDYKAPDTAPAEDGGAWYIKRFAGWYTAADGGELVEHPTGNITVYAHYTRVRVYRVTFDKANGDGPTYAFYESGAALVLPEEAPSKNGTSEGGVTKGYVFEGWYVGEDKINGEYKVTADITVTAHYTESRAYTITLDEQGGEAEDDLIVAEGDTPSLPTPAYQKHRFDGWYQDARCETPYTPAPVRSSFTLYAKWVEQVTVTYTSEGKPFRSEEVDKGSELKQLSDTPTKEGETLANGNVAAYTFEKWTHADGSDLSEHETVDKDTELTAAFTQSLTRNGVALKENGGGSVTYTFDQAWTASAPVGMTFADVDFGEHGGEIKYTLTFNKATDGVYHRMMFAVKSDTEDPAPDINPQKNPTQGYLKIDINLSNGSVMAGAVVGAQSGFNSAYKSFNAMNVTIANNKYEKFAQFFNAATPTGTEGTFDIRVVYGKNFLKIYIDEHLIVAYGDDLDLEGETLYGKHFTSTTLASGEADAENSQRFFKEYLAALPGGQAGMYCYQNFTACNQRITFGANDMRSLHKVTYVVKGEEKETLVPDGDTVVLDEPPTDVTGDNENGWFATAFVGWYTAEEGGELVEAITGDMKIYARFDHTAVYKVEFDPANGSETTSAYLPVGGKVQFPAAEKANDKADGFDCSYTLRSWLFDGQEYTAYTVTADKGNTLTFVAQYDVARAINQVVVTTDEDGDVYTSGDRGSQQGFAVPDHEMAEGGEFSYEITYTKGTAEFNHRTALFLRDAGIDNITGNGDQGYIFINVQLNTGTVILSRKIRGTSTNIMELPFANIKDCAYKTNFSAATAGTQITLSVRVQFGKGWVKYWMEDCLLFTYCAEADGETNYGATWTEANVGSASDFINWMKNPEGTKVGFIQWNPISRVGGKVVIRKLQYKTLEEIGKAAAIANEPQAVTLFVKKKEEV